MPLAPGRERAVASLGLCEAGRLELALLLGVCFSMNTAISSSNSISRASTRARLSALIFPAAHSDSKRAFSASNSVRSDALFHRGHLPLGLDRHHRPQHREALSERQRRVAPAPSSGPCA